MEETGIFASIIVAIALFIAIPVVIIRQIDHHFGVANCPKYGQQYNRDTKFVDYNYFNYGCLARTTDGEGWLPIDQLRDVTD